IGGLVFTILIARLLLPELFGVYTLVSSIAAIAIVFSDFGLNLACLKYLSNSLKKKDEANSRSYFRFFFKLKIFSTFVIILLILILSKIISLNFFNKPLVFLPLIFSSFYILTDSLRAYIRIPFVARKQLEIFPPLELIHQFLKISLSLLALLILSDSLKVSGIFISMSIAGFLFLFLESFFLIKKDKKILFGKVNKINIMGSLKYTFFIGLTGLTLIFFGSVDTLMLGRFVKEEYIGFYRAALGLIISITSLINFSGLFLPVFTQLNKQRLRNGFELISKYLLLISLPISTISILLSKYIILIIYGVEYLNATPLLLVLSFLIVLSPLIGVYIDLFQAKEKITILAKFVFISLIINIFFNYLLIKHFLTFSQQYATMGAGIATLMSQFFLLGVLYKRAKKRLEISIRKVSILKPLFSTGIMALFLIFFKSYVKINLFSGILMILLGGVIYISLMFLTKGLTREDIFRIKLVFQKKYVEK
ncbi:MAG: oligosaccharide flippase family protein, partial [Candidatus Pacearchaeota archaeon]